MNIIRKIKYYALILVFISVFLFSGCCGSKYNYYTYRSKAEEALIAKNYKKAQNYYSIIYTNESKKSNVDTEKTTWAFYRLGVISEVTGNLKMAKGYYWGDAIDEGFYDDNRLTSWFAQAGWEQLDEKNMPRTLEEILEFETTEPPEEDFVERKKDIVIPKKNDEKSNMDGNKKNKGIVTQTINKSRIRSRRNSPDPLKVIY